MFKLETGMVDREWTVQFRRNGNSAVLPDRITTLKCVRMARKAPFSAHGTMNEAI